MENGHNYKCLYYRGVGCNILYLSVHRKFSNKLAAFLRHGSVKDSNVEVYTGMLQRLSKFLATSDKFT